MTKKHETVDSTNIASSPERHTFQKENYIKRCIDEGKPPSEAYLQMWDNIVERDAEWAQQEHKNDLEYDLRSTDWIVDKARNNDVYAQNIYAALCNMQWQRIDVWPVLKNETWSCSWRSAGGIVADLRGEGDYIDWYCSGIRNVSHDEEENKLWDGKNYVPEGTVTDEIRADFLQLGWQPVPYKD